MQSITILLEPGVSPSSRVRSCFKGAAEFHIQNIRPYADGTQRDLYAGGYSVRCQTIRVSDSMCVVSDEQWESCIMQSATWRCWPVVWGMGHGTCHEASSPHSFWNKSQASERVSQIWKKKLWLGFFGISFVDSTIRKISPGIVPTIALRPLYMKPLNLM